MQRSAFAQEADQAHAVRRPLAQSLLDFARRTGTLLIAEGVEEAAELAVLEELGVDAVQGYLLGRPVPVGQLPRRARSDAQLVR